MNNEIKEILENCEKAINEASGYNDTTDKIIDYITNLQEENEILKEAQKNFEKQFIKEMDYKSRIEKAVEYIEKLKNFKIKYVMLEEKELYAAENDFVKDLLNILNGRSDE